jgi:hypothetical protein
VKTDNISPLYPAGIIAGHVGALRAGTPGVDFIDASLTAVDGVQTIQLAGLTVTDLGDGVAQILGEVGFLAMTVITPAQLVANTDNWAPVDATSSAPLSTATIVRASTDASRNLTGIVAPTSERLAILENVGAQSLVLKHNTTSTAANRFLCPGDTDLTIPADGAVVLEYDLTSARWRVIGASSAVVPAGTYELAIEGGQDVIKAHGSMGSTETFDPTDGNVHTGTLNANCTFTLNAPSGSGACTLEFWLTEDGTGGWTVTWPGSVTEQGTHTTTLGTTQRVVLETIDGGANWIATWIGTSVTSVALTAPAEFSVSGSPITGAGTLAITKANETANTVWAGPTSGSAAQPTFRALVAADIPSGVGTTDHEHIDNLAFNGDGSTTVFELPAAAFDAYSYAAYVAGVRVGATLSGAMLTVLTFDTAPASGTANITVDLVAAVA